MSMIKKAALGVAALGIAASLAVPAIAGMSSKTIVDTAAASKDHETLVAAVTAAGLVETLQGEGPFTVFAPVDDAFAKLPEGTVETLLKPENKDQLAGILTYHVVPGDVTSAALVEKIQNMDGKAELTTVQGETLTAMLDGNAVKIMDRQGNTATVTAADLEQSNGVIHVIDTVLLP